MSVRILSDTDNKNIERKKPKHIKLGTTKPTYFPNSDLYDDNSDNLVDDNGDQLYSKEGY